MTPLPRAICPVCGREVAVRVAGELREHTTASAELRGHRPICSGSGRKVGPEWAVKLPPITQGGA